MPLSLIRIFVLSAVRMSIVSPSMMPTTLPVISEAAVVAPGVVGGVMGSTDG